VLSLQGKDMLTLDLSSSTQYKVGHLISLSQTNQHNLQESPSADRDATCRESMGVRLTSFGRIIGFHTALYKEGGSSPIRGHDGS